MQASAPTLPPLLIALAAQSLLGLAWAGGMSRRMYALARAGSLAGLFLAALWCSTGARASTGPLVEQAWVEDISASLSLAEVQQMPTRLFNGALSRGYGPGAVWIRLRIDPAQLKPDDGQADDPVVMRIRPVYLDDIQVFDPLAPGGLAGVLGDLHHPRRDGLQGTDFLLPLQRGVTARDVWLRLSSTSVRQIHISVLPMKDLHSASMPAYLLSSLYVGLVLLIVIWSSLNASLQRDAMMSTFALKQAAALFYGLTSLGWLRAFWPADWPAGWLDQLGSYASVLAVAVGVWFHVRFLAEYRPARWAYRALQILLAVCVMNVLAVTLGFVRPALQTSMVVILLGPMACLACALTARVWSEPNVDHQPVLPRAVIVLVYALIVLLLLAASATALALAPASLQTIYISQVHGLITGILVLAMLHYRSHRIAQQRQTAELTANRATLQAAHDRKQREDQERLLAMLAHEIKTPLATMHMRLGRDVNPDIRQALREMNNVIDRCLQASQTEEGNLQLRPQAIELDALVCDVVASCSQPGRIRGQWSGLPTVRTDRQLVHIVLSNLLDNACKYAAPNSPIQLQAQTTQEPAGVRITLCNLPGPSGWPDPQRLFDKFYRAPHAQRQAGTGLGLYIVTSVLSKLGGSISYEPTVQEVRFVVHLPANLPV